jgi:hypothetical protein
MKEDATPSGESSPRSTSITIIKMPTAGKEMTSPTININAVTAIIMVLCPSDESPSGDGT